MFCRCTSLQMKMINLESWPGALVTFHTMLTHILGHPFSSFTSSSLFQILRLDVPLLDLIEPFILITPLCAFQIPLDSCFPSHTHCAIITAIIRLCSPSEAWPTLLQGSSETREKMKCLFSSCQYSGAHKQKHHNDVPVPLERAGDWS